MLGHVPACLARAGPPRPGGLRGGGRAAAGARARTACAGRHRGRLRPGRRCLQGGPARRPRRPPRPPSACGRARRRRAPPARPAAAPHPPRAAACAPARRCAKSAMRSQSRSAWHRSILYMTACPPCTSNIRTSVQTNAACARPACVAPQTALVQADGVGALFMELCAVALPRPEPV